MGLSTSIIYLLASLPLLIHNVSSQSSYGAPCPLLGPGFPEPSKLQKLQSITSTNEKILASIQDAFKSGETWGGKLDDNTTSFSLQIYSLTDTDPLFEHHFSAPALSKPAEGIGKVDSDTIYRVGSVSKLWTVYMYLASIGFKGWGDPVTKYVPELADYIKTNGDGSDRIDFWSWEEITVGSLASHLGGFVRDLAPGPGADAKYASLGLSEVQTAAGTFCDEGSVQIPCDRKDYFANLLTRHPVVAPFSTPVYSNAAWRIFTFALESITGSQSHAIFADTFVKKIGATNTHSTIPLSKENAIIPVNGTTSWFDVDLHYAIWAGGYYSTLNDMRKIGQSILNHTLLSPATTRRWMKPNTFTSNPNKTVGSPWEIMRAPLDSRVTHIYTKSGDLGLYSSQMVFLPEYNVGFNVLAAGLKCHDSARIVSEIVSSALYPALENEARKQATDLYGGVYTDVKTNSSITISTKPNEPGLVISDWTIGGLPVIPLLSTSLFHAQESQALDIRLYPSGLQSPDGKSTGFRAVYDVLPTPRDPGPFTDNCHSWFTADQIVYGRNALDEFVFHAKDEQGGSTVWDLEFRTLGFNFVKAEGMLLRRGKRFEA